MRRARDGQRQRDDDDARTRFFLSTKRLTVSGRRASTSAKRVAWERRASAVHLALAAESRK